ncbi:hypothetical protein KAH55_12665, partial [bacterium]|nr:hypothetical protein [bacterium]
MPTKKSFHYFLSCDWGSTNVRLRLVNIANRKILKETAAAAGVSQVCAPGMSTENRQSALAAVLERL